MYKTLKNCFEKEGQLEQGQIIAKLLMVSLMKISFHRAITSKVSEKNYVCKGLSVSF
jgi:hypothetical protein